MYTEMYIGHHIVSYCCPVLIKIVIIFHSITFHENSFGGYWIAMHRQADDHTDTAELIVTFLLPFGARAPKSECGSGLSASAVTQDVYHSDAELLCQRSWGWDCLEPIWIFACFTAWTVSCESFLLASVNCELPDHHEDEQGPQMSHVGILSTTGSYPDHGT